MVRGAGITEWPVIRGRFLLRTSFPGRRWRTSEPHLCNPLVFWMWILLVVPVLSISFPESPQFVMTLHDQAYPALTNEAPLILEPPATLMPPTSPLPLDVQGGLDQYPTLAEAGPPEYHATTEAPAILVPPMSPLPLGYPGEGEQPVLWGAVASDPSPTHARSEPALVPLQAYGVPGAYPGPAEELLPALELPMYAPLVPNTAPLEGAAPPMYASFNPNTAPLEGAAPPMYASFNPNTAPVEGAAPPMYASFNPNTAPVEGAAPPMYASFNPNTAPLEGAAPPMYASLVPNAAPLEGAVPPMYASFNPNTAPSLPPSSGL